MKWKAYEGPRVGDERTKIIFALLPKLCEDGNWYWLERVKKVQRFTIWTNWDGPTMYFWETDRYEPFEP